MQNSWPMIYSESDQRFRPLIALWTDLVDAGRATPQSLADKHFVPIESVAHALSCFYFDMGEPAKALAIVNMVLDHRYDSRLHIQRIRILMVLPQEHKDEMYRDAALWGEKNTPAQSPETADAKFSGWDMDPDRRLHIGFVCTYLHSSVIETCLLPVLEHLDRKHFKITLFSVNQLATEALSRHAHETLNMLTSDPDTITRAIEERKVDLLFDLNGYLRLDFPFEVFVRRPSPVQVVWFNTLTSSGIGTMQYFMSAGRLLPEKDFHYFSEKICNLKSGATATNAFREYAIAPAPHTHKKFFTFGSFTALFKINDEVIATWAKIMQQAPGSCFFIKAPGISTPRFLNRLGNIFVRHGVDTRRISYEEATPFDDMMGKFSRLDLCLNTFSYGACSTTANALWMGVPTLTLDGELLQNRVSAGFMRLAGLDEFVARDVQDYIEKSVYFAHHPEKLAAVRFTLRERLQKTGEFNPALFTPEFADACRWMWQDWVSGQRRNRQAA